MRNNKMGREKMWSTNPQLIRDGVFLVVESNSGHAGGRWFVHNREGIVGNQPCVPVERQSLDLKPEQSLIDKLQQNEGEKGGLLK